MNDDVVNAANDMRETLLTIRNMANNALQYGIDETDHEAKYTAIVGVIEACLNRIGWPIPSADNEDDIPF